MEVCSCPGSMKTEPSQFWGLSQQVSPMKLDTCWGLHGSCLLLISQQRFITVWLDNDLYIKASGPSEETFCCCQHKTEGVVALNGIRPHSRSTQGSFITFFSPLFQGYCYNWFNKCCICFQLIINKLKTYAYFLFIKHE